MRKKKLLFKIEQNTKIFENAARPVPHTLKQRIQIGLKRMIKSGILEPVDVSV